MERMDKKMNKRNRMERMDKKTNERNRMERMDKKMNKRNRNRRGTETATQGRETHDYINQRAHG